MIKTVKGFQVRRGQTPILWAFSGKKLYIDMTEIISGRLYGEVKLSY